MENSTNLYVILKVGNKDYKIFEGKRVCVDFLRNKKIGNLLILNKVMLIGGQSCVVGSSFLSNITVTAEVKRIVKGEKIRVFKKKRRKGYHKTIGHSQRFTEIEIKSINRS